jgi:hypothetical protein
MAGRLGQSVGTLGSTGISTGLLGGAAEGTTGIFGASSLGGPIGLAIGVGAILLGGLFGGGPDPAEMAAFNAEVNRQEGEKNRAAAQTRQANELLTRAGEAKITSIGRAGAGQQQALDRIVAGFRSTLS